MGRRKFEFDRGGTKFMAVEGSEALANFLEVVNDIDLAREWAQKVSYETMNDLYHSIIDLMHKASEEHDTGPEPLVLALVASAAAIANAGGYNKPSLMKIAYDLPWPDNFNPDSEQCQGCDKHEHCKEKSKTCNEEGVSCNAPKASGLN